MNTEQPKHRGVFERKRGSGVWWIPIVGPLVGGLLGGGLYEVAIRRRLPVG